MPPSSFLKKNVSYEQFTASWNPVQLCGLAISYPRSVSMKKGNRIYVVENQPVLNQCEHTVTGTVRGT